MSDFAFKYGKSLPNPYNPSGKSVKVKVTKKEHHTPEPRNDYDPEAMRKLGRENKQDW